MTVYSLKKAYALRFSVALQERISGARIFYNKDLAGLIDNEVILWPVKLKESEKIRPFSYLTFKYTFQKVNINSTHETFIMVIETIIHKSENTLEGTFPWLEEKFQIPFSIENKNITKLYLAKNYKRWEILKTRNSIYERTRDYFKNRGFQEIETPYLVHSGSLENYLNTFETQYINHNGNGIHYELPTSPELSLKKILCEGPSKIFQISKAFRNCEESSKVHMTEFHLLEWYRCHSNLESIINDTKNLVITLSNFLGSNTLNNLTWPTFEIQDLFLELFRIDLNHFQNTSDFCNEGKKHSPSVSSHDSWDTVFFKLMLDRVEPYLNKKYLAYFLKGYPKQMSALSAPAKKNFCERFELYLKGIEICNGYFELTDAKTLQERMKKTESCYKSIKRDINFEKSMAFGLPMSSGNALGLDRLIKVLLNLDSIKDLYYLPMD